MESASPKKPAKPRRKTASKRDLDEGSWENMPPLTKQRTQERADLPKRIANQVKKFAGRVEGATMTMHFVDGPKIELASSYRIPTRGDIADIRELAEVWTQMLRGNLTHWGIHSGMLEPRAYIAVVLEASQRLGQHLGAFQAPSQNERDIVQQRSFYETAITNAIKELAANGETWTREQIIEKMAEYDPNVRSVMVQ